MKHIIIPALVLTLTGCNSMYIKPNTLDKSEVFYADRGGYSMKRSVKEQMEERGYKVIVGKSAGSRSLNDSSGILDSVDQDSNNTMNSRYIVKVTERREYFLPMWCAFNGFWWWNFNMSIADQKTGEEVFSWRARGCANSSLNKLDNALDRLEIDKKI